MQLKRFLFLLTSDSEINEFIKFSKALNEKYPNIEKDLIYIKNILKYDIFPLTIQGIGLNTNTNLIMEDYIELEDKKYLEYKEKLEPYFRKIYSAQGEMLEICLEEMKAYDLLVVCKDENNVSDNLSSLLKYHYKPLVVLSNSDKEYSFDKVLMLNDGGYRVNASTYQYFNIFGIKDIDVLRVNIEDKNRLTERFGSRCNIIDEKGEVVPIILEKLPNYDIIIMGDLKYSLLFEKLTGQVGVKILENALSPIFIG